jgi:hypothetical protein
MKSNSFFKHFIIDINIFWSGNTNSTACHLGRRMDSGSVTHNPKSRLTKDHFSPNFSAENFNMILFLIICIITCILVCRLYTWRPYILLYAGHIYSYMSVLHTLMCRSYILLNVSPLYSNMSMLYTVICQLSTLSYYGMPTLYTVICRCFQCDMVVYRRGRHCHTWVHTTDSLWMTNQNTFLFLLLDTLYFKTINIWLW